jgi:DNA primase
MGVIDEVKQRTDVVEVISQYASLTKSGRTFRGLCPFHSEKNPSFFVYPEQQTWHCFGACNTGGDVYSFIMKKEGIEFGEALRLLADRAGITISTRTEREAEGKERLYQANQAAVQYFHNLLVNSPAGEKARKYVASRGFSPKTIADFQLGFSLNSWDGLKQHLVERGYAEGELLTAGLIVETEAGKTHDRFRNLLMFPILDARRRTTGFGARVLDDSLPKYMNSPQTPIFDKSSSLYGINLAMAAIRQQNRAVLVEGYMDVITAHQNGLHNVVASMGTSVTEKQVSTIKRLTSNITLALDADAAGEEAMLRCVGYENSLDSEVTVIILPEGKDPDDVIKQDAMSWQRLVEQVLPVIDYTFDMVTSKLDLTRAKDKSLAIDKLLPILAGMKDTVRQGYYLERLARLVNQSQRRVEAALSRIKPDRRAKETKPEAMARALRPLRSNPVEENCLALILQHPQLKAHCQGLLPEYFEDTQNREIFIVFKQADDVSSVKEKLDSALYDYFDSLAGKSLLATQLEQRCAEYVLRLQEKFLRSLETKRQEALALAAESGGPTAELAKLQEQGIEISVQLGKVFAQKSQARSGTREVRNELGR